LVNRHHKNTCCQYDTIAGKIPSPIFTIHQRSQLDENASQGLTPFGEQDTAARNQD
jgi:hypothetical protein